MDVLPVELITNILSHLPLIDRVKCESINWKFNNICKDLWSQQFSINDNELPPTKWITECQTIHPDASDKIRSDFFRWQLTLKCPRIKKIAIDDNNINSKFVIERMPYIEHLTIHCTVTKGNDNFLILNEAKRLQTIVFAKSDCNEYEVIRHLTSNVNSIEGPSICDPWVDKWDEFFDHSDSGRFENLVKLTVVITLQTVHQFDNLIKLEQLTYVRFFIGDDFDNRFVIEYLKLRGSTLKGLELFQPVYYPSCRNLYTAVSNNCTQLEQLGLKGYIHGKEDPNDFRRFLFAFKSLNAVSLNIPRSLTEEETHTLCDNNENLRHLRYTYYMPSISPVKLKNCKRHCDEMKLCVDNYNSRNVGRMKKVIYDTSEVVKNILSNVNEFAIN